MKTVSLFSGAMGLDLGLEKAGFRPQVLVENDPAALKTITQNGYGKSTIGCDISDVSSADVLKLIDREDISAVVGGPPCQAFSVFGNREGIKDARGAVILDFVRIVEELFPPVFLLENVRGLLSMPLSTEDTFSEYASKGGLFSWLQHRFRKIGYRTNTFVVNAANYGSPQIRERIFIFGNRFGATAQFPQPKYSNRPGDGLPPFLTLGEVIGDAYIETDPDCMNFSERKLRYLSMVPAGGNWRHLPEDIQRESMGKTWHLKGGRSAYWRKLSFDYPSPTLTTMPNHAGTSMCHPVELRALTVGEYAAIQEFPEEWKFSGTATDKCRQIGNAVPVRLAYEAGLVLKSLLAKKSDDETQPNEFLPDTIEHIRPHVRTRSFWKNGAVQDGHSSYHDREPENEPQLPLVQ
jgi:DNA (cytosine-5)-methyltransferase 1